MSSPQQQFITRPLPELFGRNLGYGFAGVGVSTAIGNYTQAVADLVFPPGLLSMLDLIRTYNSLNPAAGPLGPGWTAGFSASLQPATPQGLLHHAAAQVDFHDQDGRVLVFIPNATGGS